MTNSPKGQTSSPLAIGIDFGTTKTIAALYENGQPRALPSRTGKVAMPSRVMQTKKKQLLVGWETEARTGQMGNQMLTINAIKRTLGKQGETGWGDWKTRPHEIAALLFGRLKIEVEATRQASVEEAVIAIPAHFDINQREAIQQSAQIAGLRVRRLLNGLSTQAQPYLIQDTLFGYISSEEKGYAFRKVCQQYQVTRTQMNANLLEDVVPRVAG